MRIALLAALPFPFPQGSQIYVAEQARALRTAGAEPCLITYGSGSGPGSGPTKGGETTEGATQAPAIPQLSPPAILTPRVQRAGPSLGKPLADVALLGTLLVAHRRQPFDVALAHNAEAAVVAIAARPFTGVPVVYVAHTILRHELSAYAPPSTRPAWKRRIDAVGGGIDRFIARHADGILALSEDASSLLSPDARCEIAVVPPGLDPARPPSTSRQAEICSRLGLRPRGFALYAGNLDGYQELELLDAAAALCGRSGVTVVVATHDARDGRSRFPNLTIVEVDSFEEMRALHFAAESLVLTRRRPGGFPIKLLNYMEASRPIVAFGRSAPGFVDDDDALLLEDSAGAPEIATALCALHEDPARANALGEAGHRGLRERHAWARIAEETLAFAARVRAGAGRPGSFQAPTSS
jgi:glycosyltransferase involved in cell wall biosynthesis